MDETNIDLIRDESGQPYGDGFEPNPFDSSPQMVNNNINCQPEAYLKILDEPISETRTVQSGDSQSDIYRQVDKLLSIQIVEMMSEGRALLNDLFSRVLGDPDPTAHNNIVARNLAAENILTSSYGFFTLDMENQSLITESIKEMNARLGEYLHLQYHIYDEDGKRISRYISIMMNLVNMLESNSINQFIKNDMSDYLNYYVKSISTNLASLDVKYPKAPTNVADQFGYAGSSYSQNNDQLESSVNPVVLAPISVPLSSDSNSSNYQAVPQVIHEQSYATSTREFVQPIDEQFRCNGPVSVEQSTENNFISPGTYQEQSFSSGQTTDTASTIPHYANYQPVQQPSSIGNNAAEECQESRIRTLLKKLLSGETGGGRRVKKPAPNASSCEKWLYEARKMKGQRKKRTQSYSNNESKKVEQNNVKKGNKQDFAERNTDEYSALVEKKKELEKKHAGQLNNIGIRTSEEQIEIEETIHEIEECRSCMKEISSLLPKEEYESLCDEKKRSALNAKMYRMKQLLKVELLRNEIRALWIEDDLSQCLEWQ